MPMTLEETKLSLQSIAQGLDDILNGEKRPPKIGFALFVFEFNKDTTNVNYTSNADRPTMIRAIKMWLDRQEHIGNIEDNQGYT
jgi:hypothetical protein